MKAVIYARVSSREQEETGYSLPSQQKLLKEYAQRKGFKIAKVFAISESASRKSQRKVFNEMMVYVKSNKIKIVICEKVDRLTRNFKDAVLIDDWLEKDEERQVHLVKDSLVLHKNSRSQEKLNWGIRILFAKNYIDNLSEEVKKGQKEKLRQGWLPTRPPLGYKTIGEKGHKIHIINKKTAPFLKKAFELYASSRYSLYELAKIMFQQGARSSFNNKITKSRWAELFHDPFYIGKIRWKGEIYPGKQELLVSKDLFQKVQEVLKSRATPKYRKHFPLFKSLIKCLHCNGRITWEQKKGHWYGHCNYYRFCTKRTYVRQEKVEEQILPLLDKITIKDQRLANWVQKALQESHQDEIDYHQKAREELNRRYEQIQKKLDMLYDDKLESKITLEFYDRKFKQYSQEKEDISDSLQRHSGAQTKYFELGINVLEISKRAKELYLQNSGEERIDEKRMLLSFIFSSLWLDEYKLNATYTKPFEIIAQRNAQLQGSKMPEMLKMPFKILEPAIFGLNKAKITTFAGDFALMLRKENIIKLFQ